MLALFSEFFGIVLIPEDAVIRVQQKSFRIRAELRQQTKQINFLYRYCQKAGLSTIFLIRHFSTSGNKIDFLYSIYVNSKNGYNSAHKATSTPHHRLAGTPEGQSFRDNYITAPPSRKTPLR